LGKKKLGKQWLPGTLEAISHSCLLLQEKDAFMKKRQNITKFFVIEINCGGI
jgi:hypothetical protein